VARQAAIEQARLAQIAAERARIEREGDGSEDDLACKEKKLTPSTDAYRTCRGALVAERERKTQRERELAEKQERERAERERLAELDRERKAQRERQLAERREAERLERERLAAAAQEAASMRYYENLEREGRAAAARARAATAASKADPFYDAKAQCRAIGFKSGTEKFGTCVLEMSRRQSTVEPTVVQSGDGTPDDSTCRRYGFTVGTSGYSNCRMTLDNARRSYELDLRAYEAAKAEYERRAAEVAAEADRERSQRQAQYGFCLASCSSQPGATFLGCAARCGSRSSSASYDPGPEPVRPSGRTTYLINGQIINCNTSLSGSFVSCN